VIIDTCMLNARLILPLNDFEPQAVKTPQAAKHRRDEMTIKEENHTWKKKSIRKFGMFIITTEKHVM